MPSLKYVIAESRFRFSNGSTAIDRGGPPAATDAVRVGDATLSRYDTTSPAMTSAPIATALPTSRRRGDRRGISAVADVDSSA
jgi:hypothetical protein